MRLKIAAIRVGKLYLKTAISVLRFYDIVSNITDRCCCTVSKFKMLKITLYFLNANIFLFGVLTTAENEGYHFTKDKW